MRTTLDIDDDVLAAVKELARSENKTAGEMVSQLARRALARGAQSRGTGKRGEVRESVGFRPFPSRGGLVTNELVDRLRDEDAD